MDGEVNKPESASGWTALSDKRFEKQKYDKALDAAEEAIKLSPDYADALWEMADAGPGENDPQAQPAPDYEFDQRIAW